MKKLLSAIMVMMLCLIISSCGGGSSADTAGAAKEPSETEASEVSVSDQEAAAQTAQDQKDLLAAFFSGEFPTSVGAFETQDLDGNPLTEAYFGNADVTIVHIWATYCAPCLKEMENLGKMAESLPDNAQVLGIVVDVTSPDAAEKELAKQILADNNVNFPSVIMNDDFTSLMGSVVGVPTTFIVDSEGNVVAEPIVGSNVIGYKRMAKEYLESIGK